MSSEQSFNNRSIQKNSRALFVKKIDIDSFKEINTSLKDYFFNPSKYFSTESPIQVGKKHEITEISYFKNKRGGKRSTQIMNISNSSKSRAFANYVNKAEKEKERNQFIENNKFEFVDNKRLKLIYDSFKKRINSKKKETYLKYNNSDLPLNMNMSLRSQQ